MRLALVVTAVTLSIAAASTAVPRARSIGRAGWTKDELATLRSLSLSSLGPVPADPSNRYAEDTAVARFGHTLFFDTRLSGNGRVACATCHMPDKDFQDGRPLGVGVGTAGRRTMPVAGTAYSPWQFWDGRADSQWGQALGPLENAVEHGGDRVQYAHVIATAHKSDYEKLFGKLPDLRNIPERAGPVSDTTRARAWSRMTPVKQDEISHLYANIGKAIAAYERRITFAPSRFDRYVDAELASRPHTHDNALTSDERDGLRLFIGKANCATCHNGALFTDNHFHNTGVPRSMNGLPNDSGRAVGVRQVIAGEFNCLGRHSDAKADECAELQFAVTEGAELVRAYKTPSLRNVVGRMPYMHAGQFGSLADVLTHYNKAPAAPAGKSELKPLRLSARELEQLEAFLHTLVGPLSAPSGFLAPPDR